MPVNDNQRKSLLIVGDEIIDATNKVKVEKSDSYTASNVLDEYEINIAERENSIDSNDNEGEKIQ